MTFFRRRSAAPAGVIVNDPALDDEGLRVARDHANRGDWHPAEELLRDAGDDWDRRGHAIDVLAQATVADAGWADRWCAERPADAGAAAVRGWGEVHRAWAVRGADWADNTGDEAFQGFFERLTLARGLCERAIELGQDDPTPWAAMLWLAIGQDERPDEFHRRWNELAARDPHNRLGHIAALQYLAEKWHGSHEQMYAFARKATAPWAAVLPLQAHIEYVLIEEGKGFKHAYKVADFWKDSPEAKADLDTALTWLSGPEPGHAMALHDLTVVGYALAQAERWPEARELFSRIGNRAYEYPWYYKGDPLKAFTKALRKAY
ncbi:DUF4034 domain-containing protein [Allokutzneria sp. A3M-2-11 16]|uniref:DUF4034 domain-containing protein n=1 Tax=Allokutzneria sp. A3M-2-11 16 TaxID=2962043 RepID=UPI0020B876D6|nr:DUF4034 domain-containing protein [Allokutzneria sp. A3M-2-11 16]MCP3803665.1 DUF4034 domain-containing protein [Allokutzneria sp. A3M-2-11 16]